MTMKKFIGLISAALAATALSASAGVEFEIVDNYVFRGATLSDNVNVQPDLGVDILGGAANVGVWGSFDTDASEFIEIDYAITVPLPLGEDSPVSASLVYTEYTYPNAGVEAPEDPHVLRAHTEVEGTEIGADREIGLVLGHSPLEELALELGVYYGVDGPISSDLYSELGATYTVAVQENIALDLSAVLGYLNPDEGESGFSHLTLGAGFGIVIPEIELPVGFAVNYVVETDDDVLVVDEDLYFTISFAL